MLIPVLCTDIGGEADMSCPALQMVKSGAPSKRGHYSIKLTTEECVVEVLSLSYDVMQK